MDWNNIDLESGYERGQNIIDPLSFDTLILEVYSNCREINKETVMAQFETDLNNRIESAKDVMKSNLSNIVDHIKKQRED